MLDNCYALFFLLSYFFHFMNLFLCLQGITSSITYWEVVFVLGIPITSQVHHLHWSGRMRIAVDMLLTQIKWTSSKPTAGTLSLHFLLLKKKNYMNVCNYFLPFFFFFINNVATILVSSQLKWSMIHFCDTTWICSLSLSLSHAVYNANTALFEWSAGFGATRWRKGCYIRWSFCGHWLLRWWLDRKGFVDPNLTLSMVH